MSFWRFCNRDALAVQAPQSIRHGLLSEGDSALTFDSASAFSAECDSAPAFDSAASA
jgi:hypothetical protein